LSAVLFKTEFCGKLAYSFIVQSTLLMFSKLITWEAHVAISSPLIVILH